MKVLILSLCALLSAMALAMPGGVHDVTLANDDPVLLFAVGKIQDHLGSQNGQSVALAEIVKSQGQVSNMYTYFLTLLMTEGSTCDITVLYKFLEEGKMEVSEGPDCSNANSRSLRGQPRYGGVSDYSPLPTRTGNLDDEAVLDFLDEAVCEMNRQSDSAQAYKVASNNGVKYTTQVTAGFNYRYYQVPVVLTTCPKTDLCDADQLKACDQDPQGQSLTCDLKVQSHPWLEPQFTVHPDEQGNYCGRFNQNDFPILD